MLTVFVDVDEWQLRFFANATGCDDPIYTDERAARAAGYRSLPIPPTYLFSLELARLNPFDFIGDIGGHVKLALHGEQCFAYHVLI